MALSTLVIYLFLQFLLCFYISRKIRSEADYLVADRSFPAIVVSISLFATWFGAETCIGSAGAVYSDGLSGSRADPFGYGICLFLAGALIAGRIWNKKYLTLSDFYRDRYGAPVEQLAVWVISLSSLIWGAAQLRAFGQVITAATSLDLDVTLAIGFVFVVAYTFLGGILGDVITDVVQAVVIVAGLIALCVAVLWSTPDLGQTIRDIPAERLTFIAPGESWLERMDRWAIPIFGSLVAQEVISRFLASRSKSVAVRSCFAGGGIYMILGMIPVFLGLIGPSLLQIEGDSEGFLIQLAQSKLSPVFFGVFAGAIISALLATIDSILLASAALIGHGFVIPKLGIRDEKKKVLTLRLLVFAAGVVTYIVAIRSEGIYDLLETASSFGTSGVLVITLAGLWTRFGDTRAAFLALVTGIVATPIAQYGFESASPFLVSIASALLVFLIAGLLSNGRQPARATEMA